MFILYNPDEICLLQSFTFWPSLYQIPSQSLLLSVQDNSAVSPILAAVSDNPLTKRTPGSGHKNADLYILEISV